MKFNIISLGGLTLGLFLLRSSQAVPIAPPGTFDGNGSLHFPPASSAGNKRQLVVANDIVGPDDIEIPQLAARHHKSDLLDPSLATRALLVNVGGGGEQSQLVARHHKSDILDPSLATRALLVNGASVNVDLKSREYCNSVEFVDENTARCVSIKRRHQYKDGAVTSGGWRHTI